MDSMFDTLSSNIPICEGTDRLRWRLNSNSKFEV